MVHSGSYVAVVTLRPKRSEDISGEGRIRGRLQRAAGELQRPRESASAPATERRDEGLAERVGFEPTCRLPDKTLSRRPRYDHFGTSPHRSIIPVEARPAPTSRTSGGHQSVLDYGTSSAPTASATIP